MKILLQILIDKGELIEKLKLAKTYISNYYPKVAFRANGDSDDCTKCLSIIKYFFIKTCNDDKDYPKINLKNSKMNYLFIKKQGEVVANHIANLCVLIMQNPKNGNDKLKSYEIIIFNLINYLRENEINLEKNLNLFSNNYIDLLRLVFYGNNEENTRQNQNAQQSDFVDENQNTQQPVLVDENQKSQLYKNVTKINLYMERYWYVINTLGYDFVKSNTDITRYLISNDKSYNNFSFELENQYNHVYENYEFTNKPDLQVLIRIKFWLVQNFELEKQKQFFNIHELVYMLDLKNICLLNNNETIKLIVENPKTVYFILSNEGNKQKFIKDVNKFLEEFENHSEAQSENYNDKLKKFNDDFSNAFKSFSENQEENNLVISENAEVDQNQINLITAEVMKSKYPEIKLNNSDDYLVTIRYYLIKIFPNESKKIYLCIKKIFSVKKLQFLAGNFSQHQHFIAFYCKYCYENKNQNHLLKLVEPQFFSSIDSILRQLVKTNEKISNVLFSRICFLVPRLGNKFIQNHAEYIVEILYLLKSDKYFKILEKEINGYTEEINRMQYDKTIQITPPAVRRTLLNVHVLLFSYCTKMEEEGKSEESKKLIENMNNLIKNIKICAIPRVIIFLTIPVINYLIKDFMENNNNNTEFQKCINDPVNKLKELYYNEEINNLNEITIFRPEER